MLARVGCIFVVAFCCLYLYLMSSNRNQNVLIFRQRCTVNVFVKVKVVWLRLFTIFLYVSSGVKEVWLEKQMLYSTTVTDYLLNTLLGYFVVDLMAISRWTQ